MPQQADDTPAANISDSLNAVFSDNVSQFLFSDAELINADTAKTTPLTHSNIFENHLLERSASNAQVREDKNPDWAIFTLLVIITYFTALRVFNDKVIRQLFGAFLSVNVTGQMVRDENILIQRTSVLLSVLFYLAGGFFLYQAAAYYNWEADIIGKGFVRFFFFAFALALAYSVKMIVLKIFGEVFLADRQVSSYIFNLFLVNNVTGMLLLPVIILVAFLPIAFNKYIFIAAFFILSLLWLYRVSRGAYSWITQPDNSLYYLILYICALEIAPLLIIFKLV